MHPGVREHDPPARRRGTARSASRSPRCAVETRAVPAEDPRVGQARPVGARPRPARCASARSPAHDDLPICRPDSRSQGDVRRRRLRVGRTAPSAAAPDAAPAATAAVVTAATASPSAGESAASFLEATSGARPGARGARSARGLRPAAPPFIRAPPRRAASTTPDRAPCPSVASVAAAASPRDDDAIAQRAAP